MKGGYALELRFKAARSTGDIDLTVRRDATARGGNTNQILREMLQRTAAIRLDDWFEYTIGAPILDLAAAPYGGARFAVEARMDHRAFARFHVDAAIGDVLMSPLEAIVCRDWLGFAGVEAPRVLILPREQQFVEKLHAFTLPRDPANSRVKDLVDLTLLIKSGELDLLRILDALHLTFERRGTHDLPKVLPRPPADWQIPFEALSTECGLKTDINAAFVELHAFIDLVLGAG